jgi:hypothetical protein
MTTTTPRTIDATGLDTALAAQVAANAKAALNAAKAAYDEAEAAAVLALLDAGIETVTLPDGTKVTLKGGLDGEQTRTIDLTVLQDALSGSVYETVTKEAIDLRAFDAAVTAGLIPAQVAADATAYKPKKATLAVTAAVKA